jgi:hypothetical protein
MRRVWTSGGFALALLIAAPAGAETPGITAQPADTATLAAFCAAEDRAFCYGYVTAAAQFYEALILDEGLGIESFLCPGRAVSQQEAVAVFLDWYGSHQDSAAERPLDGLFRAWMAAFPCE